MAPDERGVSEVISYVLVFTLIIGAVTFVSVAGFSGLEDTRDGEQLQNAQRGFDVLRNNIADVYQAGAPSRATELSLANAQLYTGEDIEVAVTVQTASGTTTVRETITPLVFAGPDRTAFVHEGGAVFRDGPGGGAVIYEPPFRIGQDRTVIPIIATRANQTRSLGGGTVLVRTKAAHRTVPLVASQVTALRVNITGSPRQTLWNRYLSDDEGLDCTTAGKTLSCAMPPSRTPIDQLVVSVQQIQWELEQ